MSSKLSDSTLRNPALAPEGHLKVNWVRGRPLVDLLHGLWQKYGCFLEDLHNVTLPVQAGQLQIAALIEQLRAKPPSRFGGRQGTSCVRWACCRDCRPGL